MGENSNLTLHNRIYFNLSVTHLFKENEPMHRIQQLPSAY